MLENNKYPFELPALPYEYNALEPYINKETFHFHHDKHFNAYINNLNAAIEQAPECKEKTLKELLSNLDAVPENVRGAIKNNGGGVYNHDFFFTYLSPNKNQQVPEAIASAFGGADEFKKQMKEIGVKTFGSGFAWLVKTAEGEYKIISLPNQDTPLAQGMTPLLTLDVWEHAYYLQYQNLRPDFIDAWFNVINWELVEKNL